MWNETAEIILKDGKDIVNISEVEFIEEDYRDEEVSECRLYTGKAEECTINKRNMVFFEQEVDSEENKETGWSNPVLSNNKDLNAEVMNYQHILKQLDKCPSGKDAVLERQLDISFRRIAGYYSNYEYRWYEKMGHLFEEPILFYDFFYDLLRDCIIGFNPCKESNVHENDYRKAKSGVYFNQYFFGALSKRKITNLKKTMSTVSSPSIPCEICGENVTRITEFHLRHEYDESRIRKDFKVIPEKNDGKRCYDECPICHEKHVTVSHLKAHNYAESITVSEYVARFPYASLGGSIRSLHEPLTTSDDGNVLTYEDIYQTTITDENSETSMNALFAHIDDVFKDEPITAEILKLKMRDYKDSEIAEEIGESFVFEMKYEVSKNMKKKSEIYSYVKAHMPDLKFFQRYNGKFHVVSRVKNGEAEVFHVSSLAPSQVGAMLKKLRCNREKLKSLFGDFKVPRV